jgi:hypothetical protein
MTFSSSEHIDTSNVTSRSHYGLVVVGNEQALENLARECVALWPTVTGHIHHYPVGTRLFLFAESAPDDVLRFVEQRISEGAPVEIANSGNRWLEIQCYSTMTAKRQDEAYVMHGDVAWLNRAVQLFESYPDNGNMDFDRLAALAEQIARREPRPQHPLTHGVEVNVYHVSQAYERLRAERDETR